MVPKNKDDEFRGRMNVEVEHLYERLADIDDQLAELRSLVVARLDAHERYHHENEHRWGVVQWCHRYPFRMLGVALSLAAAVIPEIRGPVFQWIVEVMRGLVG